MLNRPHTQEVEDEKEEKRMHRGLSRFIAENVKPYRTISFIDDSTQADNEEEKRILRGLSRFVGENVNPHLQENVFDDSEQVLENFLENENKREDKPNVTKQKSKTRLQKILEFFYHDKTLDPQTQDMPLNVPYISNVGDGSYSSTTIDLLQSFAISSGSAINSALSLRESIYKAYSFQYETEEVEVDDPTVFQDTRSGYYQQLDDDNDPDRSVSFEYPSDPDNNNDLEPSDAVEPPHAAEPDAVEPPHADKPNDASEFLAMRL